MPRQISSEVDNNFTRGLITEATGLNFPENAATATSNCLYTLIGDVTRREGINFEINGTTSVIDRTDAAITTYIWNSPGGDGNSRLYVKQVGSTLYFYNIATSTNSLPLSQNKLANSVDISAFTPAGAQFDITDECQYSDGNGFLFVFNPNCDPIYITYNPALFTLTPSSINIQIRDFVGVLDNLGTNVRPVTLTAEHSYNLQNQGWTTGNPWFATSSDTVQVITSGSQAWNIGSVTGISVGQIVLAQGRQGGSPYFSNMTGTVTSYASNSLTLSIFTESGNVNPGITFSKWSFVPISTGYISSWVSAEGNYPSNADVWWYFKNASGAFDPATTQPNVNISLGKAPAGHYVLSAFNQNRSAVSGQSGLTTVSTLSRPSTGVWFQGRTWYTGVGDSFPQTGDVSYYPFNENIYFSQVILNDSTRLGNCFQVNDPTSDQLNETLPTDGGVITIVGAGTIFKLFAISNGLLVFANNGVWFITGSQGIGFSATDYTITKISSVKIISNTSFIDVLGLPYFWNEEGIYKVSQASQGQLSVEPITIGTILSYYNTIPLASKQYARGSYNPIDYTIQWCFKSTVETSVTDRYQFDSILNYNVYNKAFFPYQLSTGSSTQYIHGVDYVSYPFSSTDTPPSGFKYNCSLFALSVYQHGFADEHDTTYVDWGSANFISSFTTGYKFDTKKWATFYQGQAWRRWQSMYLYTFCRNNNGYNAYYVQGVWDFANNTNSGRISTKQFVEVNNYNAAMTFKRHKIRGRGAALQIEVTSVDGKPFDLMGWSLVSTLNQGV